jgi:hypothetical protein
MKMHTAIFAFAALSLFLFAGGCRVRSSSGSATSNAPNSSGSEAGNAAENIAASDASTEVKLDNADTDGVDFAEKEEIRRSYKMEPGANVNIYGINGLVKIESADAPVAEVLIVRSAKKREDLQFRRMNIEHGPKTGLTIRVENDRKSIFSALGSIPEGRQRVILRLPKDIDLETNGVNGNFTAGEVRGRLELRGISGEVKVARAAGNTEVRGVNGGVDITFAPFVGKGIELNGVNGNIELRFEGEVNAELSTWGVNGNVEAELPNVERNESEPRRGRINARIGTGGTKIEAHGVNGNIHLAKAAKPEAATAKATGK